MGGCNLRVLTRKSEYSKVQSHTSLEISKKEKEQGRHIIHKIVDQSIYSIACAFYIDNYLNQYKCEAYCFMRNHVTSRNLVKIAPAFHPKVAYLMNSIDFSVSI